MESNIHFMSEYAKAMIKEVKFSSDFRDSMGSFVKY